MRQPVDAAGQSSSARRIAWLLAFSCAFPLLYLVLLSLARDWSFPNLLPPRFQTASWRALGGGSGGIGESLANSAAIGAAVAVLSTALGFFTSKVIARHRRRAVLTVIAHLPFALSPVILGTCLLFLFIKLGLAGNAFGVVLGQFIFCYAYAVILFRSFWGEQIQALEELVYTLGGSYRQMFFRMLLPVSHEMLVVCLFQTFLLSWFDYGLVIVIGSGKVRTLTIKVYEYLSSGNFYLAAVCSVLLIVPPLFVLLVNRRILVRRLKPI